MYHYKDRNPEDTIELFKSKLSELGLTFTESNVKEVINGVWSATVMCNELPQFCSNGKGLSRELCLASAYGELVEIIENFPYRMIDVFTETGNFKFFPDERYNNGDFYSLPNCIVKDMISMNGGNKDLSMSIFKKLFNVETKFKNIIDKTDDYLPFDIIDKINCSNGAAAGNTYEEACVEAISEIFERYAYRKIFEDKLTPPEIDRHYISEKYSELFKVILKIESELGTNVSIYDCSLGKGYPVLCLVSYDKKNHTYRSKLGSHPLFEIALERCITEFYQCFSKEIYKSTCISINDFTNRKCETLSPIMESFIYGFQIFPVDFFKSKVSWNFREWTEIEDYTNEKGLKTLLDILIFNNNKIYIKNNNWLGIPAVYVYIPELSFIKRDFSIKSHNELLAYKDNLDSLLDNDFSLKKLKDAVNYYVNGQSYEFIYKMITEYDLLIHSSIKHKEYDSAIELLNSMLYIDNSYKVLKDLIKMSMKGFSSLESYNVLSKIYDLSTLKKSFEFFESESLSKIILDNRKLGLVTNYLNVTFNESDIKNLVLKIKNKMIINYKG